MEWAVMVVEGKYYKVVCKRGGVLRSAVVKGKKSGVTYKKGEWVHAPEWLNKKGYGLLVFDDKERAIDFASKRDEYSEVWECEIGELFTTIPKTAFLNYLLKGKLSPYSYDWPDGTQMVRHVKLYKRVWRPEMWK